MICKKLKKTYVQHGQPKASESTTSSSSLVMDQVTYTVHGVHTRGTAPWFTCRSLITLCRYSTQSTCSTSKRDCALVHMSKPHHALQVSSPKSPALPSRRNRLKMKVLMEDRVVKGTASRLHFYPLDSIEFVRILGSLNLQFSDY